MEIVDFHKVLEAAGSNQAVLITDIEVKNGIVYFKANGHQYQTFQHKVHNKNDRFFYDGPFINIDVEKSSSPERMEEEEEALKNINKQVSDFMAVQGPFLYEVFCRAISVSQEFGYDKMVEFVRQHMLVMPPGESEEKGLNLLKEIIKRHG